MIDANLRRSRMFAKKPLKITYPNKNFYDKLLLKYVSKHTWY